LDNQNVKAAFAQMVLQEPSCKDDATNGFETDVDCGGGSCPLCKDSWVAKRILTVNLAIVAQVPVPVTLIRILMRMEC